MCQLMRRQIKYIDIQSTYFFALSFFTFFFIFFINFQSQIFSYFFKTSFLLLNSAFFHQIQTSADIFFKANWNQWQEIESGQSENQFVYKQPGNKAHRNQSFIAVYTILKIANLAESNGLFSVCQQLQQYKEALNKKICALNFNFNEVESLDQANSSQRITKHIFIAINLLKKILEYKKYASGEKKIYIFVLWLIMRCTNTLMGLLLLMFCWELKIRARFSIEFIIFIGQMSIQAVAIFSEFVNRVPKTIDYRKILLDYENHYNLRKFKITEILADSALSIFQHIVEKFYKNHNPGESGTWVENQLRLFLWTVICYIEIQRKNLNSLQKQDWDFFSSIFFVKEYSLFEYQARILLDESIKITKWTDEQDYMLYCIIIKDRSAKWNQIAKSLFISSNKMYLRASKQCRERWLNHLDPSKSKSEWSLRQYLIMFQQVYQKGKKWAVLVKILKDRRSEHSIKNKYNSIIKKQSRLTPELSQQQICRQMIQKINRIIENNQIESNDEYLFGCSLKQINTEMNMKNNEIMQRKIMKSTAQDAEEYRSRFENFRKKIQKFQCYKQIEHPQIKVETRMKRPSFSKQNISYPVCKIKKQCQFVDYPHKAQDEIFEESFDQVRPQEFNFNIHDDFRSIINQRDLQL